MSHYEDGILLSLRRIARASDLYSRQLATRIGLTGPQLVCLRHLHQLGPMAPSRLSREIHLSQATVTGIVDRLSNAGLVTRTRSGPDRRVVTLDLTDAGRELMSKAPSPLHERLIERLRALPEDEQRAIHQTLERVVDMMDVGHLAPSDLTVADLATAVVGPSEILLGTDVLEPTDESEVTK